MVVYGQSIDLCLIIMSVNLIYSSKDHKVNLLKKHYPRLLDFMWSVNMKITEHTAWVLYVRHNYFNHIHEKINNLKTQDYTIISSQICTYSAIKRLLA